MASMIAKTRKSTAYMLPAQIIKRGLGFVYIVVLARYLSIDAYGIYNFMIGTLLVFAFLTNFGFGSSLQRFLPEYSRLGQDLRVANTIRFAHVYRFVLTLIVFLIAWLFFDDWAGFFGQQDNKTVFTIFLVGAFMLHHVNWYQLEFNALFMHGTSAVGQVVYTTIKVVAVLLAIVGGMGLSGVFIGEALAFGLAAVAFTWIMYRRVWRVARASEGDDGSLQGRRLLRYSAINAATMPSGILYSSSMDFFVIAAMASPQALGLYALASRASKMLLSVMPQNMLQGVIRPAFYQQYYAVQDQQAVLQRMFRTLVILIAACLFPVLIMVAITSEPLITVVFGEKYTDALPVFLVFIVFSAFTVLELPSDLVIQAIEKPEIKLYAQIFAIYNIVAAVLLLPEYGIYGVAYATGTALMLKSLFLFVMARRHTGIGVEPGILLRILINSLGAGVVTWSVLQLGDASLWFIPALLAGGASYLGFTYINNFMTDQEKILINKFAKRQLFDVHA